MAASFFFYDLETTGIRTRECRIMQFAGQRTDMDLKPVGEPFNILIKLTPDVLPDPEAVLLTGITPQATLADGITEFEFLKIFETDIATPDTIFVGYNTVRFDDEFIRCTLYRNFYDPYEWHWKDGRSRWDLLDLVRMTRALRPEGIKWPLTENGVPANRLELITAANGLDHAQAHDALSDVRASIVVAKLIKTKQPQLFKNLLDLRSKKAVQDFLSKNKTFIYTSGKYDNRFEKTAVVQLLQAGDDKDGALVYDLRHDPQPFAKLSPSELAERWQNAKDLEPDKRLPVKTLKYNRCPAICALGVLKDEAVQTRLGITIDQINANKAALNELADFRRNIVVARNQLDTERDKANKGKETDVDGQVYEGLLNDRDRNLLSTVRSAAPSELPGFADKFHDTRMRQLLPRYKARNFPDTLTDAERQAWEEFRNEKLFGAGLLKQYFDQLAAYAHDPKYADKQFLLEELQLYGQSLIPTDLES